MAGRLPVPEVNQTALESLQWLVKNGHKAQRHKKECEEIAHLAQILQDAVGNGALTLNDGLGGQKLVELLQPMTAFIEDCLEKTIAGAAYEVVWEKRVSILVAEFKDWGFAVILNNSLQSKKDLESARNLLRDMTQTLGRIETQAAGRSTTEIDELRELLLEFQLTRTEIKRERTRFGPASFEVTFEEDDTRLSIDSTRSTNHTLRGKFADVNVECPYLGDDRWRATAEHRHGVIYKLISVRTHVQAFYGIARRKGKYWAVMQDLEGCVTLSSFLRSDTAARNFSVRLRLIYDIAKAVAYLHSLSVVVKRLSDFEILVKKEGDTFTPILTKLSYARLLLARTDSIPGDVRYEAPEYALTSEHTQETDLWSLGVLLWQCMTRASPFGEESAILPNENTQRTAEIRRVILQNAESFKLVSAGVAALEESRGRSLSKLIQELCQRDRHQRTPAETVAKRLYDTIAAVPLEDISLSPDVKVEVRRIVRLAAEANAQAAGNIPQLEPAQLQALSSCSARGDPYATYLYGAAIFEGAVSLEQVPQEHAALMWLNGTTRSEKVRRAKVAVKHLDFAVDSDVQEAFSYCARAHGRLQTHYTNISGGRI